MNKFFNPSWKRAALALLVAGVAMAADDPTKPEDKPAAADFSNFRIVSQRNIFNQNRVSRRQQSERTRQAPPKVVDSFTLVGTMSYPKGYFAFFDGPSSLYRKTAKPTETIAGYTIKSVAQKGVVLELGTNTIDLHVGMQMRKQEDGTWKRSASDDAVAYSSESSGSDASTSSGASGEANDILKKLMQKREQELK